MPPGPFTSAEPARSGKILLPNMRQVPERLMSDVALPLNRLCLTLCGATILKLKNSGGGYWQAKLRGEEGSGVATLARMYSVRTVQ